MSKNSIQVGDKVRVVDADHGGARAGAGRPKSLPNAIRRTVYLEQRHVDLIARQPGKTFSEALRHLLDSANGYV
jgi:hypothetical protein